MNFFFCFIGVEVFLNFFSIDENNENKKRK